MHGGGGLVGARQRSHEVLIGPVVDVDEAEIVILAIGASAGRVIGELEPVRADDLRHGGEVDGGRGGAARPLGLRRHRHQMAVVAVGAAVLVGGEEPLRD